MSSNDRGAFNWKALAQTCGMTPTPGQAQRLDELAHWLAERAFPLGFTNYPSAESLLEHHVAPVLALFCLLPLPPSGRALDLGAGSGALGLTLSILAPDLKVLLADRRRRSAQFIGLTVARLGIHNAEAMQVDAEGLAKTYPEAFDLVCFRALAPAPDVFGLVKPLPRAGGSVVAWHQSSDDAFLHPPPGWERVATLATSLPGLSVSQFHRAP